MTNETNTTGVAVDPVTGAEIPTQDATNPRNATFAPTPIEPGVVNPPEPVIYPPADVTPQQGANLYPSEPATGNPVFGADANTSRQGAWETTTPGGVTEVSADPNVPREDGGAINVRVEDRDYFRAWARQDIRWLNDEIWLHKTSVPMDERPARNP